MFPKIGEHAYMMTLAAHGFMWFMLAKDDAANTVEDEPVPVEELPILVLFDGWNSLFRDRVVPWRIALSEKVRAQLEREVLPPFVSAQRWYAGKGEVLQRMSLQDHIILEKDGVTWLFTIARAERATGEPQTTCSRLPWPGRTRTSGSGRCKAQASRACGNRAPWASWPMPWPTNRSVAPSSAPLANNAS